MGDRGRTKPNRIEAEGLLSGIMLDTRDFTLHTGVRTFEAAAALRRYGAETEHVRQLFDVSMVEYTTKATLVSEAQMYRGCAITVSGEVAPEARVAIAQAANDLLTIQNVEASFVAVQVGGGVNISARSLGAVNVQVINGVSGRRRPSDHGSGPAQAYHPGGGPQPHPDGHRPVPGGPEKERPRVGIRTEEKG